MYGEKGRPFWALKIELICHPSPTAWHAVECRYFVEECEVHV